MVSYSTPLLVVPVGSGQGGLGSMKCCSHEGYDSGEECWRGICDKLRNDNSNNNSRIMIIIVIKMIIMMKIVMQIIMRPTLKANCLVYQLEYGFQRTKY